jgi:uncharacterized damage-inducible protein DinB
MIEKELLDNLVTLFDRDIKRVEDEIRLFKNDEEIWKIEGEIKNSAGNLALHLCGNLQYYIGKVMGGFEYTRNREHEFAAKGISQKWLLQEIQTVKQRVHDALRNFDPSKLQDLYPEKVFDHPMTNLYFLMHLHAHLNYHLGQINYHRRLVAVQTSHIK